MEFPAVDNVSFSVARGGSVGLVGQSGSGKTTLCRAILRLTEPTSGTVRLDGDDIGAYDGTRLRSIVRRRMRLVFQHPDAAMNPALTVGQSLELALKIHTPLASEERAERLAELLDEVELPAHFASQYPRELSGGEKRRVGICRCLATSPDIIFADEPVAGLDVTLQRQVLDILLGIRRRRGVALVVISHDLNVVRRTCDEVGVMHEGRLVDFDTTASLLEHGGEHPYTRALVRSHARIQDGLSARLRGS